jgi:hypothetical protein
MAAKQQISVLELFINAILKVYAQKYLNFTLEALKNLDDAELLAF